MQKNKKIYFDKYDFRKANVLVLLLAAILLAGVLEVGIFNRAYFMQFFQDAPRKEIDLTTCWGYNGEALPLLPENPTVAFDKIDIPVRSVTVHTSGPVQYLRGNIGIRDEASAYSTTGAGSFQVNPGGKESVFTVLLNSHGNVSRMRVNFTDVPKEPVFFLSVVLNERLPMDIHPLRLLLLTGTIFVLFCIFRFRWYAQDYQPDKKQHRLLNLAVMGCCLFVSFGIFYVVNPEHTYLKNYPTLEEVRSPEAVVDAYMQQLDAFEKGRISLDLDVNPQLDELDNVYDKGERDKKSVGCHWDRAYYEGKYYSYFGLAPLLTVYYPVYWLTGMLPTELLTGSLLTCFAIISIFAAIRALFLTFKPRANLLLFLLGEAAVVSGSFLYMIQASASFYYLPLISAVGWLAAFTACSYFACLARKTGRRAALFALAGISFVMLVLSRPNTALLAVAFVMPLFLRVLFDKEAGVKEKFLSAVPFLIPVLLGAAAIMYYNFIRFDSLFEFGTTYQLTESDIRYNRISLSLHHFASMFYHYFMTPFAYSEFFPFLRFTAEKCVDFGNYLYQGCSVGLFMMPLNLGVFLLGLTLRSGRKQALTGRDERLKKQTYALLTVGILALGYINFMLGGIHIRYVCDLGLTLSILSFLLILEHIHFDETSSAKILYWIAAAVLLVTIGRGLLLIFSNETNDILLHNPDFYVWAGKMFRI